RRSRPEPASKPGYEPGKTTADQGHGWHPTEPLARLPGPFGISPVPAHRPDRDEAHHYQRQQEQSDVPGVALDVAPRRAGHVPQQDEPDRPGRAAGHVP